MGPLIQIAAAGAAMALTAILVLTDARAAGRKRTERAPRGKRRERRAKTPRIKPEPRRRRRRTRDQQTAARDAAIVDFTAALRDPEPETVPATSVGATALEARPLGRPVLRPDPERLIQHEVVEPDGPMARLGAFLRLLTWVGLAGVLLAAGILAAVRTIALMVENAIG